MISKLFYLFSLVLFFTIPVNSQAQQGTAGVITLEDALTIADAAEERAGQDNWTVVIAVVDSGGHLITLRRIDGTQIGSINFAIEKARSSVYFKRPTKVFEDAMDGGNNRMLGLSGAVPFEGGIPIEQNGQIIGAVGVSGATAEQDGIVAQAGIDALQE
ncbi:MAG: heme-binding protein [Balneolaceae bacterium]